MSNDKEINVENDNGGADVDSSYQPPPQKTIEEIVAADQEDESLRKYKEALLGAAQSEKIIVGECGLPLANLKTHFPLSHSRFVCICRPSQMPTIRAK